jgi:hypothetical protein
LFRSLGTELYTSGHYRDTEKFCIRFFVSDVETDFATLEKKRKILLQLIPYFVEEYEGEFSDKTKEAK